MQGIINEKQQISYLLYIPITNLESGRFSLERQSSFSRLIQYSISW